MRHGPCATWPISATTGAASLFPPSTANFQPSTTLDDILQRYQFDKQLRLEAIERLEISFRTQIIYHITRCYTGDNNWFEQERDQVGERCQRMPEITEQTVQVGFVDQGDTGEEAAYAAAVHNIGLQMVKRLPGQTGFVRLPQRWLVERHFTWLSRFRRLAHDDERLSSTLP